MVVKVIKTATQAKKVLDNYLKARQKKGGLQLAPKTQKGIRALIDNQKVIKSGETKTADIVKNTKLRSKVFDRLRLKPELKPIYNWLGGKNLKSQQQRISNLAGMRPSIAKAKKELNKKVKDYFAKQIKAVKSGRGDVTNLLASRAATKLKMAPGTYDIRKSQFNLQIPKSLKRAVEYTRGFVASPMYQRLGQPKMTLKKVQELMAQSKDINRNVKNSYERVLKFLDRSVRFDDTPVVKTNNAKKLRDRTFQIGNKKIDYKYILNNFETDPLFAPMKNVEAYKAAVYTSKFVNPKTGKIQPLNEIAFDLVGRKASDLLHVHHAESVALKPLESLQIVFGPINRYAYNLERRFQSGKINADEYTSIAKKYNFGTNTFQPKAIPVEQFAQEAYQNVLNMYKNKISLKKVLGLNTGGIVNLNLL